MLELQFANPDRAKSFSCSKCPNSVKALRRCAENRWDFTDSDGSFWPIRIQEGGGLYGFCPGKATWNQEAVMLYKALLTCDRTGAHWQDGGISDQPDWWIELVSEFLPRLDEMRFYSRARAILGDGKTSGGGSKDGSRQKQTRV